ncbi:hypothetical protein H4R35_003995 [Dimargaris xerosporica]|nr:hypothetical protein H4R35_003995 [Dimargaris xerosporica]
MASNQATIPVAFLDEQSIALLPRLTLQVDGLPQQTTALDLHDAFAPWGSVRFCQLYLDDDTGEPSGRAQVIYQPAPDDPSAFLSHSTNGPIQVRGHPVGIGVQHKSRRSAAHHQCAMLSTSRHTGPVTATGMHLGVWVDPQRFVSEWIVPGPVHLNVCPHTHRLTLKFAWQQDQYRLVFDAEALQRTVWSTALAHTSLASTIDTIEVFIDTTQPPRIWRHSVAAGGRRPYQWRAQDAWERAIAIPFHPNANHSNSAPGPLSVRPEADCARLGEWSTYLLSIPIPCAQNQTAERWATLDAIRKIQHTLANAQVYDYVVPQDPPNIVVNVAKSLANQQQAEQLPLQLPFEVGYLVQALLVRGSLNAYNITQPLVDLLRTLAPEMATHALTLLLYHNQRVYRPVHTLRRTVHHLTQVSKACGPTVPLSPHPQQIASATNLSGPSPALHTHGMWVRRIVITPTRVYLHPPQWELANRALRCFAHLADRFIRVTFCDENFRRLDSDPVANNDIYARLYRTLEHGLTLCGRRYEFLGYSASQLRTHGCWFFAPEASTRSSPIGRPLVPSLVPTPPPETTTDAIPLSHQLTHRTSGGYPNLTKPITADLIRQWMGDFSDIRVVAKAGARIGQCFSTTIPVRDMQPHEITVLEDVKAHGYTFSDGVGLISPTLMAEVVQAMSLATMPSAVQFRLGGYKGVLTLAPWLKGPTQLMLRVSQRKFRSCHQMLEIVQPASATPCYLNRQIILLLSTLGLPDAPLLAVQEQATKRFGAVLNDPMVAQEVLQLHTNDYHIGTFATSAITAGFFRTQDPFLMRCLQVMQSSHQRAILSRARIPVTRGVRLMGVLDEYGVLNENEVFVHLSNPPTADTSPIITGLCAIFRNPCFHPGDVRVVKAVDHPALRYLKDVVVFPAVGHRDLPSQLSGGDLDGDFFSVIWEPSLVPMRQYMEPIPPMDYTPPLPVTLDRPVTIEDIKCFFVQYIVHDNLGLIDTAHLIKADKEPNGALHGACLRLAYLHSNAVDFPKTGVPATIDPGLMPTASPDFMNRNAANQYPSPGVLGRLYRAAQSRLHLSPDPLISPARRPILASNQTLGTECRPLAQASNLDRINTMLVAGFEPYVVAARQYRDQYHHTVKALVTEYGITDEAELVSGIPLGIKTLSAQDFRHGRKSLNQGIRNLWRQYQAVFFQEFGVKDPVVVSDLKPDVRTEAMLAKAAAWYYVTYHPSERYGSENYPLPSHLAQQLADAKVPLGPVEADPLHHWLSFPWCVHDLLCILVQRRQV